MNFLELDPTFDSGKSWLPTRKHYWFFTFLQISPSFQLACDLQEHEGVEHTLEPEDLECICRVHNLVGKIAGLTFDDWWLQRGARLFNQGDTPRFVSLEIDTAAPLIKIQEQLKEFEQRMVEEKQFGFGRALTILKNKITDARLEETYEIIQRKAGSSYKERPTPNWKIYLEIQRSKRFFDPELPYSRWEKIFLEKRFAKERFAARDYLNKFIAKGLDRALIIAENAARGVFPSDKKPKSVTKFNYDRIDRESLFAINYSDSIPFDGDFHR